MTKLLCIAFIGFNKRRYPIYLFKPFDFHYPDFLVASGIKKSKGVKENQLAVIRYNKWERKIPNGMIREIIGSVGDIKAEYDSILHKYNLNKSPPKLKELNKRKNLHDIFGNELSNYTDIRKLKVISIDRSNRAQSIKGIKQAESLIQKGYHVIVLPEGTRTKDGKLGPFKKGGFHMAINTKTPILLVAHRNTHLYKPKNRWTLSPRIIEVEIGPVIDLDGCTIENINQLMEKTWDEMNNLLQ